MSIIVWELILVAVVGLGLGFWQLYDINRELRKGRGDNTTAGMDKEPASKASKYRADDDEHG